MEEIDETEYEAYLQGDDFYIETFKNIREQNISRFNIYAFLFGLFWLLYRRMYLVSVSLLTFIIVVSVLEESILTRLAVPIETGKIISYVINIGLSVLLGLYANKLYFWEVTRKIKRVKTLQLAEEEHYAELMKKGGYTLMPLIIVAALILGVLLVFTMANN